MKQLSLKNMFGYLTIACIVLALLRRPILYLLNNDINDWFHCLLAPYYFDIYLLGFEDYWKFDSDLGDLVSPNGSVAQKSQLLSLFYCVSVIVSFFGWIVAHVWCCIWVNAQINKFFFDKKGF